MPNVCNNLALRKAGRNLGVLYDEAIAASGLRGGQFSILAHVHGLERPTMKELADELVMDLSALGHTLKPLERDGYVALVRNELDGRSKRVVLTESGTARLKAASELWYAAQQKFDRAFGAAKAQRMREMMALIASDDFSAVFRGEDVSRGHGSEAGADEERSGASRRKAGRRNSV